MFCSYVFSFSWFTCDLVEKLNLYVQRKQLSMSMQHWLCYRWPITTAASVSYAKIKASMRWFVVWARTMRMFRRIRLILWQYWFRFVCISWMYLLYVVTLIVYWCVLSFLMIVFVLWFSVVKHKLKSMQKSKLSISLFNLCYDNGLFIDCWSVRHERCKLNMWKKFGHHRMHWNFTENFALLRFSLTVFARFVCSIYPRVWNLFAELVVLNE